MFGAGPLLLFGVYYRLPTGFGGPRERRSVHWTNFSLLVLFLAMCAAIGLSHFLMILLPVMLLATGVGTWLFYVQHQFEGVYWERDDEWDYFRQAIDGSSFYRLPRVLQWFTGNIGYHHVHHLSHRIPNYRLEKCHEANALFGRVHEIDLWTSLRSLKFRLWDEEQRQLVGFAAAAVPADGAPSVQDMSA
jgi:omega-6 fatty acid desaturase (delta-12 desaturase)